MYYLWVIVFGLYNYTFASEKKPSPLASSCESSQSSGTQKIVSENPHIKSQRHIAASVEHVLHLKKKLAQLAQENKRLRNNEELYRLKVKTIDAKEQQYLYLIQQLTQSQNAYLRFKKECERFAQEMNNKMQEKDLEIARLKSELQMITTPKVVSETHGH